MADLVQTAWRTRRADPPPPCRSVADAMVRRPAVHPPTTSVAEARAALADPHRHLLLIVAGTRLLGTLDRADLAGAAAGSVPALLVARLAGRTVRASEPLEVVRVEMAASGQRRRAVVDHRSALLGLLCLNRSGVGFCSDEGIAARARERATSCLEAQASMLDMSP